MVDYRSNKTCEEIDAILDNAVLQGSAEDTADANTMAGLRKYVAEQSASSLIMAGTITSAFTILDGVTVGAVVSITREFAQKYKVDTITKRRFVIVEKRVAPEEGDTLYIYPQDYPGCYFVMGAFDGNNDIFGLGASTNDWIISQERVWVKIATTQRNIAGIKGDVTADALVKRLSTQSSDNANPVATKSDIKGMVKGVTVNNATYYPDTKGNVSLPAIPTKNDIANMGFTQNKGTVTGVMVNGESKSPNSAGVIDLGEIKVDEVKFANDLTGVIEATPEMFTYRPSAGDKSVRDESAVIRRIKGNTSVWNNIVNITGENAIVEVISRGYRLTPNKTPATLGSPGWTSGWCRLCKKQDISAGHKHLIIMTYTRVDRRNDVGDFTPDDVRLYWEEGGRKYQIRDDVPTTIVLFGKSDPINQYVTLNDCVVDVTDIVVCDLTKLFGKGNEPTTLSEFYAGIPSGIDIFLYNYGEVIPARATGIETIGFNAYNGEYAEVIGGQTYYLGVTIDTAHFTTDIGGEMTEITIPENRLYTPPTNGYIYATGSDICINLSHSGVRNGEYKPYEKNTLLLPEIAKYFPNGMHGIGDVFDEINEEMAIQRCAVRAYEEGDENNAEVKTDKITTVYKLAVPVYTPIDEPLQLDYKVDDFGTERMLSDLPSSPFRADIVYQFNAEGRIRDNSRNIEKLEKLVKQPSDWLEDNPNSPAYIKNKPALPTQVATATEVIVEYGIPAQMLPNVVYESAKSIENFTFPQLVPGEENVRNVWKLIAYMAPGTVISYPLTIRWRDGIPPTIDAAAFVELTFTSMTMLNAILGEWKLYK